MTSLADLKPGDNCIIRKMNVAGAALQRLIALGFLPGQKITVLRNAPLLDPFDIQIRQTMVAVRKAEARLIEVELL
ncbi:MAG: iron transporter FeoA [Spirochaetales bacterium]|nr:MAG: iron transporter FeoA [Spirochaetales bacterium]